jgi:hypothetical protein
MRIWVILLVAALCAGVLIVGRASPAAARTKIDLTPRALPDIAIVEDDPFGSSSNMGMRSSPIRRMRSDRRCRIQKSVSPVIISLAKIATCRPEASLMRCR